jgi:hypothetical protein
MTLKCYSQRGDQLLNLAFLLQSDEQTNHSAAMRCSQLQPATVAQFDRNFRAMLFGYIVCAFNEPISFAEKLSRLCEDAIGSKVKADRLKYREVFVYDFSKLQFETLKERAR